LTNLQNGVPIYLNIFSANCFWMRIPHESLPVESGDYKLKNVILKVILAFISILLICFLIYWFFRSSAVLLF